MCKDGVRVVIADDEPISRMDLTELLTEAGYTVVAAVSDGFDAVEKCKEHAPDLVMLDIKMPLLDGLGAAKIIYEQDLADTIVMVTAYSERDLVNRAKDCGVSGYLVKPIDEKSLVPNIEVAIARSREMKQLRQDIAKVNERLEGRAIIEKAKGLVMEEQKCSEQTAYDYIRRISLDKKLSMRRVAEIILMKNGV